LTIQENNSLVSALPWPLFVPGFSCGRKGNPAPLLSHEPFFRGFIAYTGTFFFFYSLGGSTAEPNKPQLLIIVPPVQAAFLPSA